MPGVWVCLACRAGTWPLIGSRPFEGRGGEAYPSEADQDDLRTAAAQMGTTASCARFGNLFGKPSQPVQLVTARDGPV